MRKGEDREPDTVSETRETGIYRKDVTDGHPVL